MKLLKILLITIIISGLAVPLLGCGSESDEAEPLENQIATVQRGDLIIDITAAGNLALSRTEDLAFEIAGTVEEVLAEEGDTVEEGQVLVKLDTDEWNDELSILEKAVVTAQRSLTAKQSALASAEREVIDAEREVIAEEDDVTEAEREVTAKEFAVRQAQVNLQDAEYNLSQIEEVEEAQEAVDDAEYNLKFVKSVLTGELGGGWEVNDYQYWLQLEADAEADLAEAEEDLQEILDDTSLTVSDDVALQVAKKQILIEQKQMELEDAEVAVENAQKAVDDAKYTLEDAELDVEDAKQSVENAKLDVEDTRQDVEDAQSDLDEAKSLSSVITAPFAGFVTNVNVEGGDEILRGTVAVQIADPNKFEAEIMVSEMDISQVKEGGEAWVQVDAMQGMSLPAEVTHISPTATIQSGVVNYKVKVEVQSLEAVMQERQEAMQGLSSGELPERLQQAIEEGRITQEQAEEMIKQRQQEQGEQQTQMPTMIPEDFQLREGLTVTVSILVDERTDVLLVPNSAITTEGRQTFVQVLAANGTLEQRAIQAGLSDWQYTEVTEGLSEGEQVVVPQGTTTILTPQQGQGSSGFRIPGLGRPH